MTVLRVACVAIAGATAALLPAIASAQGNDRMAPIGGRAALMGDTGVALARDAAAPFLNPATTVNIENQRLAFSVNFITLDDTVLHGWNQPGPVDATHFGTASLPSARNAAINLRPWPSTLCLFFTLSPAAPPDAEQAAKDLERAHRQKLAVCLATVERQQESFTGLSFLGKTGVGPTNESLSIQRSWQRMFVGPTYAIALSSDLTVGISLHGSITNASTQTDGASVNLPSGASPISSTIGMAGSGHSIDLMALLGATYRMGPVTLGASVETPALHLYGSYDATLDQQYAAGSTQMASLATASGNFHAPPPVRFALGAGVTFSRWVAEWDETLTLGDSSGVATDLTSNSVTVLNGLATQLAASSSYAVRTRPVLDTAVGAEYFVTPRFSVLGGARTSFTSIPALDTSTSVGSLVQARTNQVAVSTGVGSYGGGTDLLMGVQLSYAWGQALGVNPFVLPNAWATMDVSTYAAMLILAGTTDLAAMAKAVEKVKDVITP